MEQIKAWAIVVACVAVAFAFSILGVLSGLDHWDKARAKSFIEVADMKAKAEYERNMKYSVPQQYDARGMGGVFYVPVRPEAAPRKLAR